MSKKFLYFFYKKTLECKRLNSSTGESRLTCVKRILRVCAKYSSSMKSCALKVHWHLLLNNWIRTCLYGYFK